MRDSPARRLSVLEVRNLNQKEFHSLFKAFIPSVNLSSLKCCFNRFAEPGGARRAQKAGLALSCSNAVCMQIITVYTVLHTVLHLNILCSLLSRVWKSKVETERVELLKASVVAMRKFSPRPLVAASKGASKL